MLQVSNSQLAAFNNEARPSLDQQATPKERFGLHKKRGKRKVKKDEGARDEDTASIGNTSSRSAKRSVKSGKSKRSGKSKKSGKSGRSKASVASRRGDPSLPESVAGGMQVTYYFFVMSPVALIQTMQGLICQQFLDKCVSRNKT